MQAHYFISDASRRYDTMTKHLYFQALHLGLVGNPFGPAGTGKTESVKALGGLFGRLVLVFNCDEVFGITFRRKAPLSFTTLGVLLQ